MQFYTLDLTHLHGHPFKAKATIVVDNDRSVSHKSLKL